MALPLRDEVATRHVPWVTIALIVANAVVFLFLQPSAFQNPPKRFDPEPHEVQRSIDATRFAYRWGAVPCEVVSGTPRADQPDQCPPAPAFLPASKSIATSLLTSLFLHASTLHLAGNMLFLWVFGNNVEDRVGPLAFLVLYLAGGVAASLGFVVFHQHAGTPLIGASGAVAVAMGAYLVFHPRGQVLSAVAVGTFQLVYLPAAVVLGLFFVTQFFTPDNGVAWEAHAVGMVVGALGALGLARAPWVRRRAAEHDDHAVLQAWEAF